MLLGVIALAGFLLWIGQRWSMRLMRDAILVYGSCAQCPRMRWAQAWFVLWFVGSVTGLSVLLPGPSPAMAVWVGWLAVLGLLGLIDARTGLLPNELTIVMMFGGVVWQSVVGNSWMPPPEFAWGMVLGWFFPYVLNWLHECWRGTSAIGEGDAKLLGGIGAWLGLQALPLVWIIACVAVLVYTALVWGLGQGRSAYVTFGPFLAVGASLVMLLNYV